MSMTVWVENETETVFPFPVEELVERVANQILDTEKCPYETVINVLITDNEGIREYNREYRNIDRETDVLSFPNIDFDKEADFTVVDDKGADYFDPDSGELVLGDIVLSTNRIYEQAENYGHSVKREFAFLIAHSMLHLMGYDHIKEEDRIIMEGRQKLLMETLEIPRE